MLLQLYRYYQLLIYRLQKSLYLLRYFGHFMNLYLLQVYLLLDPPYQV